MSVLVTGGTGATGYHLLSGLTRGKGELISFSHSEPKKNMMLNHVKYLTGEILNFQSIADVIKQYKPKEIYHLATQKNAGVAHLRPFDTLQTNILGTQNLLEAVRKYSPKSKVMLTSSSNVYGKGEGLLDVIHGEEDPIEPITSTATSMAAIELLGKQYHLGWGLHVFIVRPFNFTGPSQDKRFVLPNIAEQIIKVRDFFSEPLIYTGNIDVSRDIIDIRDMTRAFMLLMGSAESGSVYNICSGKVRTIRELIEQMIELADVDVELRRDPARERSLDQPLLMGSPEKLMVSTGWKPMIDINDTLKDILNDVHNQIHYKKQATENLLL